MSLAVLIVLGFMCAPWLSIHIFTDLAVQVSSRYVIDGDIIVSQLSKSLEKKGSFFFFIQKEKPDFLGTARKLA